MGKGNMGEEDMGKENMNGSKNIDRIIQQSIMKAIKDNVKGDLSGKRDKDGKDSQSGRRPVDLGDIPSRDIAEIGKKELEMQIFGEQRSD